MKTLHSIVLPGLGLVVIGLVILTAVIEVSKNI